MRRTVVGFLILVFCCSVAVAVQAQQRKPRKVRKENSFLGIGIGLAGYWPDTSNLSTAFTEVENSYRDRCWTIPGHTDFSTTPLITYSLRIQTGSSVGFVLEAAQSLSEDKLDALSGTLLVELVRDRSRIARPYVGAGVTQVSFEFKRKYGVQIGPDDGSGGFPVLESIVATGSNLGANFVGGIQFVALHARFVVQAAYWWIPEFSNVAGAGTMTTMNMSSFLLSAQLMFTLP